MSGVCPGGMLKLLFYWYIMDRNFQEAIKSGLSKRPLKSLKEGQRNAVEGYLSGQYLFVYARSGFFVLGCFLNAFEEEQPFVQVL